MTVLLKETISIGFDQNLLQRESWPTEDRIRQKREDKHKSEKVRSWILYFMRCGYSNF
jgi:hypothetical protein